MTFYGWLTMILSVGFVLSLFSWCIFRVITSKGPVESLHGIDDIDTKDGDDAPPLPPGRDSR